MRRRNRLARSGALIAVVALIGSVFVVGTTAAGASSGPFSSTFVTVHQTPAVICRANGGSLNPNAEADQNLGFSLTYPRDIHAGDTFNLKIKPDPILVPRTEATGNGLAPKATVYNLWGEVSGYQLPAGLTINNVTTGPIDGNVEANPDAGYYVNQANIPIYTDPLDSNNTGAPPGFDPMTLPASTRLPIPGVAPNAFWNTSTNRVYESMLGSNTAGSSPTNQQYAAGSGVQGPTITVNVTATANIGSHLNVTLAGQVPGGTGANFLGAQPGNFSAPASNAINTSTPAVAPWFSTNGLRYVYTNPGTWTDPSFTLVVTVNALLTVSAAAACGPGWEPNTDIGTTPPSYYAGPTAIPNGTSPPLSDTVVDPYIQNTTPADGATYVTGQSLNADYHCWASILEEYDSCTGTVPVGSAIDTATPGAHTFAINGTDANNGPLSKTVNYTVVDPGTPVASAGANQTGKVAGNVITLDGSGSTSPNPGSLTYTDATGQHPSGPNTFTWTQTGGPTVTLSDPHAIKPTFAVAPVASPSGDTYTFSLLINDGFATNTASTTVTSVASTPTVAAPTKSRVGGGTSFFAGDLTTLSVAITNPDGTSPADYNYNWVQTSGIPTTLSSNTAASPTFTMPTQTQTAGCTSGNTSSTANCPEWKVTVTKINTGKVSAQSASLANYSAALPTRPVANAGAAQNAPNPGGATITLDGSGSTQANSHTISYAWTQTGGPTVTLSSATAQKPTFTSPAGGSSSVPLTFSLTVTDTQSPITGSGTNGNTSTAATTTVTIVPDHVVATASASPTSGVAGTAVTLDGSASTDPNLAPLTYTWTQVSNGAPAVTLSNPNAVKPTFTAPPAASPSGYVAQFNLTATNGGPNPGDTDTTVTPVSITIAPSTPTATVSRTPSGTVFSGDTITLSTTITNPDGNNPADYSFLWSQASGIATSLSSTTAANPTFVLPANGTAACTSGTGATNCPRFQVVVTKVNTGKASTAAALASYTSTAPTRPVANAGPAQGAKVGASVQLDGSASTQAQGHPLTYAWSQTAGTTVSLSSTTAQKPTFTAPSTAGALTFSLVVTDPQNPITSGSFNKTSAASTVTITVSNYASPVASAGSDQSVAVGAGVTLNASGSSQADSHALTYLWTQTAGPTVSLSDATAIQPTFTAPNAGATLKFTVTVTDTQNPNPAAASTTSAPVTITVNDYASPVASAGSDQTVNGGTTGVTLDASGSSQADNHTLTYQWTQVAGPTVTLSDATAIQPTFTAPNVGGVLQFLVTVTDTQNPNPAAASTTSGQVAVTVIDFASPVASAGSDQSVHVGDGVTLHGTASQADDHALTYQWTQTAGPAITLSDSTVLEPTFTAPNTPAVFSFKLTVTDTQNPDSATATTVTNAVTITVNNYASPYADAGPDQSVPGATLVTLDASGSVQADNHTLSYHWIQTSGPAVTLSNAFAVQPTFTAPSGNTSMQFTVTVTDTQNPNPAVASTTSAPVTIAISNFARPVASAGSDQSVVVGSTGVTLDASGSSQANNHTLSYDWTQTAGTAVTLSDANAVQPTFTAPNAGTTLKFTVTVTDTQNPNPAAASATSSPVTVTVSDYASPVAGAGTNQSVKVGSPVSLAGTASQADNHSLTYHWTQTAGPAVTLSNAAVLNPSFTAPASPTALGFTLTVTDTQNPNPAAASVTSSAVTITVNDYASPVVSAGADQSVQVSDPVSLAGSASQADNHTLTYHWTQTAGPAVSLSSAAVLNPSFTAPASATTLKFTLTATDTQNPNAAVASTTSSAVTITVSATAPTGPAASVGDVTVVEGNTSSRKVAFRVTLSQPATSQVTVNYTVTGVTATVGAKKGSVDVQAKTTGSVLFKLGASGKTASMKSIGATIWGNTATDGNRTFKVTITSVVGGAVPGRTVGTGTIIDDDGGPSGLTVGVGDAAIVEGNSGTRSMIIPVTLSDVPAASASVTFTVTGVNATYGKNAKVVGADFGGKQSGTLTWTAGGTRTKNVTIPVWADAVHEGNETFTVTIATPSGVTIVRATGTGTIIDDE